MRGVKRDHSARVIMRGHALMQNLRRGHYASASMPALIGESRPRSPTSPRRSKRNRDGLDPARPELTHRNRALCRVRCAPSRAEVPENTGRVPMRRCYISFRHDCEDSFKSVGRT
jgi:hypothetical protein